MSKEEIIEELAMLLTHSEGGSYDKNEKIVRDFYDNVRLETIKEIEDVLPKEIVNPNEDDWYSILSGEALAHNVVIYEIKDSLNKLK